jgi:hypothetical protein
MVYNNVVLQKLQETKNTPQENCNKWIFKKLECSITQCFIKIEW